MNGSRASVYMVTAVFYVLSATAIAGHPRCTISFDGAELDICSGEISPVNEVLAPLAALEMSAETSVRVVKFDGSVGREQVTALESLGAEVLSYAPHFEFTFEPTATGAFAITLSVDFSDSASPHDFELQGEGVSASVFEDRFEQP